MFYLKFCFIFSGYSFRSNCHICPSKKDDNKHQTLECPKFNCAFRKKLLEIDSNFGILSETILFQANNIQLQSFRNIAQIIVNLPHIRLEQAKKWQILKLKMLQWEHFIELIERLPYQPFISSSSLSLEHIFSWPCLHRVLKYFAVHSIVMLGFPTQHPQLRILNTLAPHTQWFKTEYL